MWQAEIYTVIQVKIARKSMQIGPIGLFTYFCAVPPSTQSHQCCVQLEMPITWKLKVVFLLSSSGRTPGAAGNSLAQNSIPSMG